MIKLFVFVIFLF